MADPSPPRRQRGAPRGNHNAFKHGFYSRSFVLPERNGIEPGLHAEFADEEALLRDLVRRAVDSMKDREISFEESLVILRAVSYAVGRIESLHRFRKITFNDQIAIEKILEELAGYGGKI
jgi:hypothetical protein